MYSLTHSGLTHSCLEVYLTSVVCIYDSFQINLRINHKFTKNLMGYCELDFDQHFSCKYFPKIAFVQKISPKKSGSFGRYRHEWVKVHLEVFV